MLLTTGQKILKYAFALGTGLCVGLGLGLFNLFCSALILSPAGPVGGVIALSYGVASFCAGFKWGFESAIYYHKRYVEKDISAEKHGVLKFLTDPFGIFNSRNNRHARRSASASPEVVNTVSTPSTTALLNASLLPPASRQSTEFEALPEIHDRMQRHQNPLGWRVYLARLFFGISSGPRVPEVREMHAVTPSPLFRVSSTRS